MSQYVGIRSEGGLIPYDVLDKIAKEEPGLGQQAKDFGLPAGRRLTDEIARAWSDAQDYWHIFQRRTASLPESENGTTLTRKWISDLLNEQLLGYELTFHPSGSMIGGKNYPISHRAGSGEESPPVQIEGFRIDLDRRPEGRRLSPQALVQEYLNNSDSHLWGVVTNGFLLRLLRDTSRTSRPRYLEFDLQSILDANRFNEFALFYRVCHRTRLPKTAEDSTSCWLEKYFQLSIEQGGRVREKLRVGVEDALKTLGTGLLRHPNNTALRERVKSGALSPPEFHRQLLRLVYRLLFLMVAEERRMIVPEAPDSERRQHLYDSYYGVGRLRNLAETYIEPSTYGDLWIGLQQTLALFGDGTDSNPLGIPPLNGALFSETAVKDLQGTHLYNDELLAAMKRLSLFEDHRMLQRVNYGALDVEELGSVYESLLDYKPIFQEDESGPKFQLLEGGERKETGSYYTRPELVRELIENALVPVMSDLLDAAKDTATTKQKAAMQHAILSMTVCDPACGSGHFLLAAARRLGRELAKVRTGEDEPTPKEFHLAVRDVITHCIYGVDVNPLAVDLCKLALWLEGHWTGKPLSFLDHRIRCGNSLVGVLDSQTLETGVPDDAFNAVAGDVKSVATAFKRRNKAEAREWQRVREQRLFAFQMPEHLHDYASSARQLLDLQEETPADVRRKAEGYGRWRFGMQMNHDRSVSDMWTYAFFAPLRSETDHTVPTHKLLMEYATHIHNPKEAVAVAEAFANERRFFHWRLEFPDIFERGGFDVVLGNPPWEKIKLEEQEHWIDDPYICDAPTKAERIRRIEEYRSSMNPTKVARVAMFESAKHYHEAISKFVRSSRRWPLTAVGDINTYALFAELGRELINSTGRIGIVVPINIATDDTTKVFFGDVVKKRTLVRLIGFENEAFIFPAVHNAFKFCALIISGPDRPADRGILTFFCRYFEHVEDPRRRFELSPEDFELINPNTRTCPVFRTRVDAEITKKIYRKAPVLLNNATGLNPWGVEYVRMFDMSNDSALFIQEAREDRLALYEAKMFWHFDHRFATYEGASEASLNSGRLPQTTSEQKADRSFRVVPLFWVDSNEVQLRISDVPPTLAQAARAESEDMARAVLLPWWSGYAATQSRSEDAEKLLQSSVHVDLWNMSVRGELIQYMLNDAAARSLQERWPLTPDDMEAILHCKNFLECARTLIEVRCPKWLIAFRGITSGVNERTAVFAFIPLAAVGNSAPVLRLSPQPLGKKACLVANLSAIVFDFVARQKLGGTNMNFFIVNQLPVLTPAFYLESDVDYISNRAFRLICTADDLQALNCEAKVISQWDEGERAQVRGELDAYFAHLYGLTRDELAYILDPKDVLGVDFPSETFRVLREREEKEFGEYRTRRLVLEAFDKLADTPRFRDDVQKRVTVLETAPKHALASVS